MGRVDHNPAQSAVDDLLAAWDAIPDTFDKYFLGEPVADGEFDAFELEHGLRVPEEARAVLRLAREGIELGEAGVAIHGWPLETLADFGLPELPPNVPSRLRVIGGNLGDDVWAVWLPLPGESDERMSVVVIREHDLYDLVPFDGLGGFLRFETAFGLLFADHDDLEHALDELGVPPRLRRRGESVGEVVDELSAWATGDRERVPPARKAGIPLPALEGRLRG
jgi:hypothetical protein